MKKNVIILCLVTISSLAYTQVGISTSNPQGTFHVDGAKDNPTIGVPNVTQQANDFTVTSTGNVGIGNITPSSNLHITNRGTATGIGGGEATNTGLLIENPIANSSLLSILKTTGVTGIKQAVMGINPNFNGNNGVFIISRTVGGSDLTMDLTTGNLGVAVNAPTNTLDVNGTTRVRTINQAAGTTIISPVYADPAGVLMKSSTSATYGGFRSNTVTVASGATGALITDLAEGLYKVTITTFNACAAAAIGEFLVHNINLNSYYSLNGQDGLVGTSAAHPTFTQTVRNIVGVTWTGVTTCADGSDPTGFNYTLTMPSVGIINITNNGNVSKAYRISLTRLD